MNFQDLIGLEINSALEILSTYDKKIVIKDNNSNVEDHNMTSVVRIIEHNNYLEIITSNFKVLN